MPGLPRASTVLATIEPGEALKTRDEVDSVTGEVPVSFTILRTTQVDGYESEALPAEDEAALSGAVLAAVRGDNFNGTARKAAKTSVATGETEKFADLQDLIAALPPDKDMIKLKIPDGAKSNRVAQEKRNVQVRAFIYAASREDDNDFHVIIGRHPDEDELYMNIEVSGLPAASHKDHATLKSVRNAYKRFFNRHPGGLPGTRYDFYKPPVPVTVTGSLFFDVTHAKGGKPGPEDLRDNIKSIWEIHPVTRLEFRRA